MGTSGGCWSCNLITASYNLHVCSLYLTVPLVNTGLVFYQWWDATGVRLMWLRESVMNFLDSTLTRIDFFLLKVQDLVIAVITFFLKPIANIYRRVVPPTTVCVSPFRSFSCFNKEILSYLSVYPIVTK